MEDILVDNRTQSESLGRSPHPDAYDPFAHYFISQNNKNEFLQALETSTASAADSGNRSLKNQPSLS